MFFHTNELAETVQVKTATELEFYLSTVSYCQSSTCHFKMDEGNQHFRRPKKNRGILITDKKIARNKNLNLASNRIKMINGSRYLKVCLSREPKGVVPCVPTAMQKATKIANSPV